MNKAARKSCVTLNSGVELVCGAKKEVLKICSNSVYVTPASDQLVAHVLQKKKIGQFKLLFYRARRNLVPRVFSQPPSLGKDPGNEVELDGQEIMIQGFRLKKPTCMHSRCFASFY